VTPRISLCLIARDEEAMLPDCLASARQAVDEIVLVDTGSTDRTMEIARAAGAKVVEMPWPGDFCPPRNLAVVHATGDWILQLDCDERLAPGAARALRAEVRCDGPVAGLLPLHDAASLTAAPAEVVSGRARLGEPIWLPRLLRRLPDLAWTGYDSVTDFLERHGLSARWVPADIVHLGAVPELRRARGKSGRNLDYLGRLHAERPDDLYVCGLLAQELLSAGRYPEARQVADRGWSRIQSVPRTRLLGRLAVARALLLLQLGEAAAALTTARAAAQRDGVHPDLSWLEGRALEELALGAAGPAEKHRLLAEAERAHGQARACSGQRRSDASIKGASTWLPLAGQGRVRLQLGRRDEAGQALRAALAEQPGLPEARLGLLELQLQGGDAAGALSGCEPLLDDKPDAWVLAAAAARALGAETDAALLAARAAERAGKGFLVPHLQERLRELRGGLRPAAPPPLPRRAPVTASGPGRRFAVTIVSPRGYPHAEGFREVAEALHHGLLALGHDSVLGTDLGLRGRQHLLLGANLLAAAGQMPPPGAILYNLEQVQEGSPWFGPELLELYRRHPVWDYSRQNVEALARLGLPRPRLVPLGFVPELCRIAPAEEDIDVLFYGSVNERRRGVLEELARRGVRVHAAFGVYGAERDRLVARSRLVLNVHYYEAKVFEIVRVSYLLANRRAVVSETGSEPVEERGFDGAIAFAPYARLVETCLALLGDAEARRRLGEAGLAAMQARPQAEYLRAALAEGARAAGHAAPRAG